MFNIILTFIFFLFLPGFNEGDVALAITDLKKQITASNGQRVLGEAQERESISENSSNGGEIGYSQDATMGTGLVPIRKEGCSDLKIWAGASVSIDVSSGTILHYENGRKQSQIASLTKIMTAILAVENIKDFDEEVVITNEALQVYGTVVGCPTSVFCNGNRLFAGEKVRAVDLFKAMLLNSANDAATALAIHIGGPEEKFVAMMNKRATDLGLIDTHFCTPSGLETDGIESECYSSAYDIARIGAESMKYELIWETMKIPEGQFYSIDGKRVHLLKNTDLLLGNSPSCLGGKTGFTPLAGKSLLLGSTDATGEHKIISVLLNDEKRWDNMRTLIDWVSTSYEWK